MSHGDPEDIAAGRRVTARNLAIVLGGGAVVGGVVNVELKRRQKIAEALLQPEGYQGPLKHGRLLMIAAKVFVEGSMSKADLHRWLETRLECTPRSAVTLLRRFTLDKTHALVEEKEVLTESGEIRHDVVPTDTLVWAATADDAPENRPLKAYIEAFEAENQPPPTSGNS